MNRNLTVAAAVATALWGTSAFAQQGASGPTLAQIVNSATNSPGNTINVGGSSAIKNALTNSILNNFCGGAANATIITSNGTNTNFLGISCTPAAGQASNSGIYNVWLRYEGGSVTGYLPIVNNAPVAAIDGTTLTGVGNGFQITINGSSAANGNNDSFTSGGGGSLHSVIPDLGIGDVEPQALINNNYPKDYSTAVWGARNDLGLFGLASAGGLIDEVYAVYVDNNSAAFVNPLGNMKLSSQAVTAILTGKLRDWSQVFDINGAAVVTSSLAISVVNREYGSGSRAAADILLAGDGCSGASQGASQTLLQATKGAGAARYYATGDVLTAANSIAGSVTYASIDNAPKANQSLVWINGVTPNNLNAANGVYPFWVEAQYVNNATASGHDSTAVSSIVAGLQNQSTTAAIADVDAIPSNNGFNTTVHAVASNSGIVPSGGGSATVYINPFTRGGKTCAAPVFSGNTYP
jgi:hypothetical protein